jgi:hypothetical protein
MLLSELLDLDKLRVEMRRKFVSVREHPMDSKLRIYNYTHEAAYEGEWTHEQKVCRGLIVHHFGYDAVVLARPFPKFFNYGEHLLGHETIPLDEPFSVTSKEDGSLGILYQAPDGPAIATRGSFESDQATWATEHLRASIPSPVVPESNLTRLFEQNVTVLFEILAPWNRIVLDYGSFEGLVLLAVLDNETGRPLDLHALQEQATPHDGREHSSRPEDRVAQVSDLSQREQQERQGEAWGPASTDNTRLAEDSPGSVEGVGEEELQQDPSVHQRGQAGSLHGLSSDIPSVRDGLRPQGPHGEGDERRGLSQSEEDDSRDREVRSGVRQLSSDQNLGFWSGPVVEHHQFERLEDLLGYVETADADNREGFVIYFPESDLRVKVKFEEYVKLHRILTGLSERRIWEHISEGGKIEDFIDGVPDEFFDWVREVDARLRMQHELLMESLRYNADLLHKQNFETRKDLAIYLQGEKERGWLFRAYDGQWDRLSEAVWKDIKPRGNVTFRDDDDS